MTRYCKKCIRDKRNYYYDGVKQLNINKLYERNVWHVFKPHIVHDRVSNKSNLSPSIPVIVDNRFKETVTHFTCLSVHGFYGFQRAKFQIPKYELNDAL